MRSPQRLFVSWQSVICINLVQGIKAKRWNTFDKLVEQQLTCCVGLPHCTTVLRAAASRSLCSSYGEHICQQHGTVVVQDIGLRWVCVQSLTATTSCLTPKQERLPHETVPWVLTMNASIWLRWSPLSAVWTDLPEAGLKTGSSMRISFASTEDSSPETSSSRALT